ncbi:mitochondrial metal transporter [Lecanora helva]
MTKKSSARQHSGHSHHHHHHHHHDNTYLTSTNKKDAGVRITRIGLFVNLAMAIGKGLGGYFFHSQALSADAFHSLTDLVSDFLTLATVAWSLQSPTAKFPAGFGKIESLGSLGVSSLLLAGGIGIGWHSLEILFSQFFLDTVAAAAEHGHAHDHSHGNGLFGHSHSHNPADMGIPNVHAAWIAGGSIIVKEYLYRATIKVANERKSSVLASNAVHHRIDSLTSVVALCAIVGSHVLDNVSWLDPVGGLAVSAMVIRAGWGNTGRALLELADVGAAAEFKDSVRNAAVGALKEESSAVKKPTGLEVEVRDIQGIKAGPNYLMDLELAVPGDWSVTETRALEDALREKIGSRVRGVRRLRIKFVDKAAQKSDFADEFISTDISPRESPEPEEQKYEHGHNGTHAQSQEKAPNGTFKRRQ